MLKPLKSTQQEINNAVHATIHIKQREATIGMAGEKKPAET